ncbi:MAG: hypothetical protein RL660_826 [Bacteroidota bacterium]|jgi:hypothetical protein
MKMKANNTMCKFLTAIAVVALTASTAIAAPNVGQKKAPERKSRAGCAQTSAIIDLDINNVRATLMNGGDMWWDRAKGVAAYEVPKGDGTNKKNALFAGSIWIGGYDKGSGQLKVAAQTYRQGGNDYWSGPLDGNATITDADCICWDRFWKVNASDINRFRSLYAGLTDSNQIRNAIAAADADIPSELKEWPGAGSPTAACAGGAALTLATNREYAPFIDRNGNGIYEYRDGDYPNILGDQYIWWIFNDKGNTKTETGSPGIGVEISASAFAFSTNDELNDATFYNYRIINRSTSSLDSTFMATWTDADLGYAFDDLVGCDINRGLGILYNGDDFDEGPGGYGADIPMIGMDYFRGPKAKTAQGTDTTLGMTAFMFYNNDNTDFGNPSVAIHYYQFMQALWKKGQPLTKACNGVNAAATTKFAYPDAFKECNPCNNAPADRRFIHCSGPFKLEPGVVSDITVGAIWVPSVGGNCPSYGKIRAADDKAQKLFDENFKLPFGPMAPDVVVRPYDGKFTFYLNNPRGSNNYREKYGTRDTANVIESLETSFDALAQGSLDSFYKFEGYVVYQLKDESVTLSQIRNKDGSIDENKARIVFQSDVKNGITTLFNFENDPTIENNTFFSPKLMVAGKDQGIANNFEITTDAFASGSNKTLVNYRTYHYVVMAYARNTFAQFVGSNPYSGQATSYRESRTNGRKEPIQIVRVMPTPANDNIYTQNQSSYGDGIEVTRISGRGNGGNQMDLTAESEKDILTNFWSPNPTYKPNAGPIDVKITCPDSLKPGTYTVTLDVRSAFTTPSKDTSLGARGDSTTWRIDRTLNGVTETIYSEQSIAKYNEQLLVQYGSSITDLKDWGISVGVHQQQRPGDDLNPVENGYLGATITYEDGGKQWLTGVPDAEDANPRNWIRSGDKSGTSAPTDDWRGGNFQDWSPNQDLGGTYERVLGGTWAPYFMAARQQLPNSSAAENVGNELVYYRSTADRPNAPGLFHNVYSVDVVFTNDRSKWTKVSVVEMNIGDTLPWPASYKPPFSEGNQYAFNRRKHASLLKDPNPDGTPAYDATDVGHSWFPGYAINIETGERLNIVFGEDSGDPLNNGRDMIWNPTDVERPGAFFEEGLNWGGHHVVYISNTRYDAEGADFIGSRLAGIDDDQTGPDEPSHVAKREVYTSMMWVSPAMLRPGAKLLSWKDGLIPTETRVRLRVTRPYSRFNTNSLVNDYWPVYQFNMDKVAPQALGQDGNTYSNDDDALLDRLNVVPNPYYAYSEYENNRLDSRIKIINLPKDATIRIYSTDGTLVKTIQKSDAATSFVDWDLKNNKGIPVASGMYMIHVKIKTATGEKERILKWFGVMRPLDITSF